MGYVSVEHACQQQRMRRVCPDMGADEQHQRFRQLPHAAQGFNGPYILYRLAGLVATGFPQLRL